MSKFLFPLWSRWVFDDRLGYIMINGTRRETFSVEAGFLLAGRRFTLVGRVIAPCGQRYAKNAKWPPARGSCCAGGQSLQ
jgi:hypothetical protein